jgi:DNA invertase Pin-like site-specific DNA recombinase
MSTRKRPVAKDRTGERVWALLAVSSEQQADTLAHQRAWAEETASTHGWTLSHALEGVGTGKDGPRKLVTRLLAEIRALEPEARPKRLLMIRADRLGRGSIVESQIVLRDLRQLGVSIYTRDQGEVKLDSAMDELISAATLAVARHENEVKREKMLAVYQRKRAAGQRIGNRLPYGVIDKAGKDAPDGKRASVVRTAFQMRLGGNGYHTIAKKLSAIAPPQVFKNGRELIIRWTPTRIARLLTNRGYVGTVVDEATFAMAQRIGESLVIAERDRDKRRRYPWPLSGSLRCYCGRSMTGMACGDPDRRIRYYACRASWNHTTTHRLVRADDLEKQFVAILRRLRASPELVLQYRKKASPSSPRLLERALTEATKRLAEVDRKRDAAWELHVAGKVRSEDVQERLDALSVQRDEIRALIGSVRDQLAIARSASTKNTDADALFRSAATLFMSASEAQQRRIARAVTLALGGLCVEKDGRLAIRLVTDPDAQRKTISRVRP